MKFSIITSLLLLTLINFPNSNSDKNRYIYGYGFHVFEETIQIKPGSTNQKFCLILKDKGCLTLIESSNSEEFEKYSGSWEILDDNLFCEIKRPSLKESDLKNTVEKRIYRIKGKKLVSYRNNLELNLMSEKHIRSF